MVEQESQSHEDSVDNSISVTRHKVIFIGDANTGKTSIINRIIDNPFNDTYEVSIGIDFMSKNIRFRGQNIKIQIWDSAGQEKYKGLIPSYVRNSSIVFIVYDISSRTSFENVQNWISFVKNIEKTTMILCGNKTDLNREVETKEGEEVAEREGIKFFECSAKTNENIKYMFYASIAGLPTFGIIDESEKENLVKELLEENGGEENQEGGNENLVKQPAAQLNVNGEVISGSGRRRKCGC
jgi:Ras-related protein Rab-6A